MRDMTKSQFKAALKRNGFEQAELGGWFRDTTRQTTVTLGGVINLADGSLDYRATLRRIICDRERFAKEEAAKQVPA